MTGWAALVSVAASCTTDPLQARPEQEATEQKEDNGQNAADDPQKPETNGSKTLVVWYSFTGNSTAIVQALRAHVTTDALEVKPAQEGLDYAANNYAIGSSLIAAIRDNPSSASSYPAIKDVEVSFDNSARKEAEEGRRNGRSGRRRGVLGPVTAQDR